MTLKLAKNGYAILIANMCQNTIGNILAVKKVAHHPLLPNQHADQAAALDSL
jgi:hypothetical protein